jgi:hypothetical protein
MLIRRERLVASVVRIMSQLAWAYPDSPLSLERRTRPVLRRGAATPPGRPGQRLGDTLVVVDDRWQRLHEATGTAGFHVLLHRDAMPAGALPLASFSTTVHRVQTWAGDDAVVVRPDGYIGYRGPASLLGSWFGLVDDHRPIRLRT